MLRSFLEIKTVILSFLLILLCGCNNTRRPDVPDLSADTATYLQVYENDKQEIFLNDRAISLIELDKNNYVEVPVGNYSAMVPIELLDEYEQYLPSELLGE